MEASPVLETLLPASLLLYCLSVRFADTLPAAAVPVGTASSAGRLPPLLLAPPFCVCFGTQQGTRAVRLLISIAWAAWPAAPSHNHTRLLLLPCRWASAPSGSSTLRSWSGSGPSAACPPLRRWRGAASRSAGRCAWGVHCLLAALRWHLAWCRRVCCSAAGCLQLGSWDGLHCSRPVAREPPLPARLAVIRCPHCFHAAIL